jgi:competence protein ComEA
MDQPGGSETRVPVFGFAALGMIAAAILTVLVYRVWDDRRDGGIVILDPRADSVIVVAVEGAVATPGAYELPGTARVHDAIEAAGGPLADANLIDVNLARRLRDEERLIIPEQSQGNRSSNVSEITMSPEVIDAVIDLNRATAEQLESLPGIGPALADRIVAHRLEAGPFRTVDELAEIQGISARMVDELRPLVKVEE